MTFNNASSFVIISLGLLCCLAYISGTEMDTYCKLFSSILRSTIWTEPHETVRLWIAMLAIKNQFGVVESSVPGLAHCARITLPQCEAALECLLSPDPYSRTKDHEGRRIEAVDGGWRVLNHDKYRDRMSREDRAEQIRVASAKYRKKKAVKRKRREKTDDQILGKGYIPRHISPLEPELRGEDCGL